jgi:ribosomal protein L44E
MTNPAHCAQDPNGRHRPIYENGAIVTDATRLKATCQCCGQAIQRPHVRSPWWRVESKEATSGA